MSAAGLHLIVRMAGELVALPAAELDSVVEVGTLTPVPRAPPHVAGLAALRSRVLTVIDARAALGLRPGARQADAEAVMLERDGHGYAILVDAVEDAVEIERAAEPLGMSPDPVWAGVARGIVTHGDVPLLVVSPVALIAGPQTPPAAGR